MTQPLPPSFVAKKKRILEQLAVPDDQYDDLSPKGSVDEGIRELISEINAQEGFVTTSSCAGRISVFLEGKKTGTCDGSDSGRDEILAGDTQQEHDARETRAGVGGKGGGGHWLFVSHDAVDISRHQDDLIAFLCMEQRRQSQSGEIAGSSRGTRFIHFKFEPMILHVLTASLEHAQAVLSAALQAGFRESGALNLTPGSSEKATPMVGIRTMGLALESLVGFEEDGKAVCMVPEWQLRTLLEISNERFVENAKRIERFRELFKDLNVGVKGVARKGENGEAWEDAQARRERKRAEGLRRREQLRAGGDSS